MLNARLGLRRTTSQNMFHLQAVYKFRNTEPTLWVLWSSFLREF